MGILKSPGGQVPKEIPVEELKLAGEKAALQTQLQKLVVQKSRSENQNTIAVLSQLTNLRVKSAAQTGFEIDCYTPRAEVGHFGLTVQQATAAYANINYVKDTPPEETEGELKNKIFLVNRLEPVSL